MARKPSKAAVSDDDPGGDGSALPPKLVNGKPNIAHFQAKLAIINDRMFVSVDGGGSIPFNYESALRGVQLEMKTLGLDPNSAADNRTPEERLIAFFEGVGESGGERLLEESEEMLTALETACERLDSLATFVVDKDAGLSERMGRMGKRMARMIQRVRMIRARTSEALPGRRFLPAGMDFPLGRQIYRAMHPLRYMLYVMRNKESGGRGAKAVLSFAEFHVKVMWDVFKARHGLRGLAEDGSYKEGERKKRGIVIAAAPGMGKSYLAAGFCGLLFSLDPRVNSVYLHAVQGQAQRSLGFIKGMFDDTTEEGRRRFAVFPKVRLASSNNSQDQLTLETGQSVKDATMKAHGVMNAAKGVSTTLQVWDDIVPDDDLYSESERKKRAEFVGSTWQGRQRSTGDGHFIFCIANLVHPDDVVMQYLKRARAGRIEWAYSVHPCGGPDSDPPFFSIWPEKISSAELRKRYADIPNVALYQAAYQCNPTTALGRLVSAVGRYDPADPQHRSFMAGATCHLSFDPSATNRQHSDAAGVVYAAIGTIEGLDESGNKVSERRVRILDAASLKADQTELVEHGLVFARQNRVDMIHVEVAAGLHATAQLFDKALEDVGMTVNRLSPGIKSKELRLRNCSTLIDARPRMGLNPRHVVEFPPDKPGERALDDGTEALVRQLLDFGSIKSDHLVDALTQLLNWAVAAGEVAPGEGKITKALRTVAPEPTRVQRWVKSMFEKPKRHSDRDEVRFMNAAGLI